MAKQTSMATMVANLELRSTQYKREMDQATARNKKLTRELKSTSAAGDMFGRSMRGAAQGVAAIDGPLGGISGRVGALNGLLASGATSWALFGAGVAGVVATFYQSIRAGEEMERGQLKIEGLLRATGNASGRTAQQLDEQARSVARATLASISGIRDAQGVLLTFKSVQADVFDNAIVLSQDLAAVMGGDAIAWFSADVLTPQGLIPHTLRFITHPLNDCKPLGPRTWEYRARIEIENRAVITEEQTVAGLLDPNTVEQFTQGVVDAVDSYQE
ncbi:hypothetical protein ACJJIQ_00415 [Microbulbifer sp. ANSA003]|uniref:hypothetical protein n=1 Tax=Microbulbifer sp. ANSA003 TaxID=3243360 RepID=UPI00404303E8